MKSFGELSDAFDFVRESRRPHRVRVGGEVWKLFPSGRGDLVERHEPAKAVEDARPAADKHDVGTARQADGGQSE